jgi:hypothetical protein
MRHRVADVARVSQGLLTLPREGELVVFELFLDRGAHGNAGSLTAAHHCYALKRKPPPPS